MDAAGVVLVGGRSSRMGTPKAGLEWHGSTLLGRTVGVLARAVDGPVLVVRAAGQPLPPLPPDVVLVDDPEPHGGPVIGMAAGLGAAADHGCDVAFVCATDLPFLHPAYVRRVQAALDTGSDVVLPHAGGFPQPLAAAYRCSLATVLTAMAAAREPRLRAVFERCRVRELDESALLADPALAAADPGLDSLVNVNSPDDYRTARARPAPAVRVLTGAGSSTVRAATLRAAVDAVGLAHVELILNGQPVEFVPELPLVPGDLLEFHSTADTESPR